MRAYEGNKARVGVAEVREECRVEWRGRFFPIMRNRRSLNSCYPKRAVGCQRLGKRTNSRSTHAISPTAKYALHVHRVIQGKTANQMHATRTARMLNINIEMDC